jgi:hypothetical protein
MSRQDYDQPELRIPDDPDANLAAMRRRLRTVRWLAWALLLLSPPLLVSTCFLGAILPGKLGMVVSLGGMLLGIVGFAVALLLVHKTWQRHQEVQLMEQTARERTVDSFHRQAIYRQRAFRHLACGGESLLSGTPYYDLCDALDFITPRISCASCGRGLDLSQACWVDTGESLADYRQRLRSQASWLTWAWRLVLLPLLGGGIALGLLFGLSGRRTVELKEALIAAGFGIFWVMALSRIATRLGWRQRAWARQ